MGNLPHPPGCLGADGIAEGAKVKSAEIAITADNLFVLYVNGKFAGQGDSPDA